MITATPTVFEPPLRGPRARLRRLGLASLLFFLLKGALWIVVAAIGYGTY